MNHRKRNEINLKLISLVKNNELLYSSQKTNNALFERRREVWAQISDEMNDTFKLNKHVEDWKSKWRELRTYFIRESMRPPEDVRKNPAFNELYFLRPYVEDIIQARHRRSSHMSIYTMPSSLNYPVDQVLSGNECNDGTHSLFQHQSDDLDEECFEIIIEDDDADVTDESPVSTQDRNHPPPDSIDDDGDKMFGKLIVGELRKMTPEAQKVFKRNVTRLLYTQQL